MTGENCGMLDTVCLNSSQTISVLNVFLEYASPPFAAAALASIPICLIIWIQHGHTNLYPEFTPFTV